MDSKSKAIATRVPLQDYSKIQQEAAKVGFTISEWLKNLMMNHSVTNMQLSIWKEKFADLQKENEEIRKIMTVKQKQESQLQDKCDSLASTNQKLKRLLDSYDSNWQSEYENIR